MRPYLAYVAVLVGATVLMASCASSAGWQAGGALKAKECTGTEPCKVDVKIYDSGTTNCYYLSDDINIAASASIDIVWQLVDTAGNPITTQYKFLPVNGNDGVLVRPPDGYSNPRNNVQKFTWHHDPQAAGEDIVEFSITGKRACLPWHYGINPYIRNR